MCRHNLIRKVTEIRTLTVMHRELTNVRSFIKDRGYETASIDKVLHAVAEDPTQDGSNMDGRVSSSTLKADFVREGASYSDRPSTG